MSAKQRLGAAESPIARHETYQRAFQISALANLVMAAVSAVSIGSAIVSWNSTPEPRYFATREDGGIIPLVAVSTPFLNNGQVVNFAVEAVTRSLTMDFKNWREDLAGASEYFQRPDGWNNFLTALNQSGTLDFIRNRRVISNVVANGAVISESGIDGQGRYSWTVEVPITITYESSSARSTENKTAIVVVSRLPTWESTRAVGITRVVIR